MNYYPIDRSFFMQLMEKLNEMLRKMNLLLREIENLGSEPQELWLDNDQVCNYLNISKRTLQSYRDKRLIKYSQFGSKIWYKFQWVQEFLQRNMKS